MPVRLPDLPELLRRGAAARDAIPPRARVGLAALSTLVLATIILLLVFDWNWLRGPLAGAASARLGRPVAIEGNLNVHPWSLRPRAEIHGLRIGQPSWAEGDMARVERLAVQVELPPLLLGRVVMPYVEIRRPDVSLLRLADGRANWSFGSGKGGAKLPAIRRFIIDEGRLKLDDRRRKSTFEGTVYTDERTVGPRRGVFALRGEGRLNGEVFRAEVTGAPLLNVSPSRPYPFDADVRAGATRILAKGSITRPFDLGRFDTSLTITGADLNDLYGLTGLALPNTPPYRVSGQLRRERTRWIFGKANGRIGDSDIAGDLSVETRGERPYLEADLRSRRLDFDDLASIFGGAPSRARGEAASADQQAVGARLAAERRIFPDATLQVDRIRAMDAKVKYRAEAVNAPRLPLRRVALDLALKDGVLTGDPVSVSFSRGTLAGTARLDASGARPRTDVDLRLTGARLEDWITTRFAGEPVIEGQMAARAKLTGYGNSVRAAAGSATGSLTVVAPSGELRQAFAELLGVNISKGLILLLSESPKRSKVRCAVADFRVKDGVARANRIVVDTDVVLVKGEGTVNLRTERLDLRFEGESKKPRLLRLFVPITVNGPFTRPGVDLETGNALAQGGIGVALAALVNPLVAILPFVEPGLAKDANCAALIAEGKRKGAPVKTAR
ncbi:MAG: AsmA family protein [Caulobacter sp.]|nr:AsmA family protein [Caulobacter sp.]